MDLSKKYRIHPISTPVGRTAYYADDVRCIIASLEDRIEELKQLLQEVSEEVVWGDCCGPNAYARQKELKERVDAILKGGG